MAQLIAMSLLSLYRDKTIMINMTQDEQNSLITETTRAALGREGLTLLIGAQVVRPLFDWTFVGMGALYPKDSTDIELTQRQSEMTVREALLDIRSMISCQTGDIIIIHPIYGTTSDHAVYTLDMDNMPIHKGRFMGFAFYPQSLFTGKYKETGKDSIEILSRKKIQSGLDALSDWKNGDLVGFTLSHADKEVACNQCVKRDEVDDSISSAIKFFKDCQTIASKYPFLND